MLPKNKTTAHEETTVQHCAFGSLQGKHRKRGTLETPVRASSRKLQTFSSSRHGGGLWSTATAKHTRVSTAVPEAKRPTGGPKIINLNLLLLVFRTDMSLGGKFSTGHSFPLQKSGMATLNPAAASISQTFSIAAKKFDTAQQQTVRKKNMPPATLY